MWEDESEKKVIRSQMIAVVLMSVLLLLWINWYPAQVYEPQPEEDRTEERAPDPLDDRAPLALDDVTRDEPAPDREPDAWPYLPDVADSDDPETAVIENGHLRLTFTTVGARLTRAEVLLGDEEQHTVQLVPEQDAPDYLARYPLGLEFTEEAIGRALDRRSWEIAEHEPDRVVFALELPGAAEIRKTFSIGRTPHVIDVDVDYRNLEDSARGLGIDTRPAYMLTWEPNITSGDLEFAGFGPVGVQQSLVWRQDDETDSVVTSGIPNAPGSVGGTTMWRDPDWLAVKSTYFIVAFRAQEDEERASIGWATGDGQDFRFGMAAPASIVPPEGSYIQRFEVYLGPSEMNTLAAAWPTLTEAVRFFESDWFAAMDWFSKLLLSLLNWVYGLIPNYGLAIILLTCLVRLLMFPLTHKQMVSMKKMQLLAPEMQEIKEKHGEDPQEMQQKMMELYRERGVNPLGGCLPILLQMPIFIALYRMLLIAFELRGAHFAGWITDLSQPDRLAHMPWLTGLPLFGDHFEYLNVLPILAAVTMIVSMKLMPQSGPVQTPQQQMMQKMMMTIMPIGMALIFYNFSSGLNLYILTSTVLGIAQHKLVMRYTEVDLSEKKKPQRKKQHFYNAAQAKKRKLAKESRRQQTVRTSGVASGTKRPKKKPSK